MKKIFSVLLCMIVISVSLFFTNTVYATYNLIFPVNGGRVSYYYGYSEAYGGNHTGLDIVSGGNDNIYAAEAGTVVATANSCPHVSIYPTKCEHYSTYGNYIKIKHSDETYAYYGHLKQNSLKVSVGTQVSKGQIIASMGSSGYSTGKHLHFEMRTSNGSTKINVNPISEGGSVQYQYSGYISTSTPSQPVTYQTITPGNYFIKNKGDGNYLNIANGVDSNKTDIHTYTFGNYDSQVYNIYAADEGYEMMPLCSSTRVVNPYAWEVVSGKPVNLYEKTYESSQWWKFQPVGNGYVIRNVQKPDLCLTPGGTGMIVSEYTGSDNQIWILEKACTIKFDANGGSGAPSSQRVRAGYATAISSTNPTKKCSLFVGWSKTKNATTADVKAGGSITVQSDTTLYAVWSANHTYGNWTQSKTPVCNAKGEETRTCSVCKTTETRTTVFGGHSYSNWTQSKAPTCTANGEETRVCAHCKRTETRTVLSGGHSLGEWTTTKTASCEVAGEQTKKCSKCSYKETKVIDALKHQFTSPSVTKKPTCTEDGIESGKCVNCNKTTTNVLEATGHNISDFKVKSAPTCTREGLVEGVCKNCNTVATQTLEAQGHKFGQGIVTKEATELELGTKTFTCVSCGATKEEIIPYAEFDSDTEQNAQETKPTETPNKDNNDKADKDEENGEDGKETNSFNVLPIITVAAVVVIGGAIAAVAVIKRKNKF